MGPLVGENTFIHCSGPRRAPWHGRSPRSNCAYERGPARGRGCRGSTGCEWVGQKDPASSIFGAVRGSISVGVACAEPPAAAGCSKSIDPLLQHEVSAGRSCTP
eukprot:scaffold545_cov77-Phaeocystis_antarctica.AAC.1